MLQMYIIISKTGDDEDKTLVAALVSATFSMISISWGMASYARALRKAAPETSGQMTKKGVFFYFLWVRKMSSTNYQEKFSAFLRIYLSNFDSCALRIRL